MSEITQDQVLEIGKEEEMGNKVMKRSDLRQVDQVSVDNAITHYCQRIPGPPYQAINDLKKNSGLSEYFLRDLDRKGKLPVIVIGKKHVVDVIRFESFLETLSNEVGSNGQG